jgi:type II secretory pathway pseudopilin PulG
MTLLELVAVVFIIGLVGALAATRYGSATIADAGAQGFARRLALDCLQARRRAISSGDVTGDAIADNYLVRFSLSGGKATQYVLYRRQGSGVVQVDEVRTVPDDVTVTPSATDLEFTFTGESLAPYTVTVQGPSRSWNVAVTQATGKTTAVEL